MTSHVSIRGIISRTLLAALLTPAGLLAAMQDPETPDRPPQEDATPQDAVTPPEGLAVRIVAGRDRLIYPGSKLTKVRVGLRLVFGTGAPAFHPDMLSPKAMTWIDAAGKEVPLVPEVGELQGGTLQLPVGTVMRTAMLLDASAIPEAGKGFKLRWNYPGATAQELAFSPPRVFSREELPDIEALTLEQVNRSLVRVHVAKQNAAGERERIGALTFRLAVKADDLVLARSYIKQAVVEEKLTGFPVFHIQKDLFFLSGHPLGETEGTVTGIYPRMLPPDPPGTTYARGDLVLLATLFARGPIPTRNMWYGQMLVPFGPLNALTDDKSPASRRIGVAVGDTALLALLSAEPVARDSGVTLSPPVAMLVLDGFEYMSFE